MSTKNKIALCVIKGYEHNCVHYKLLNFSQPEHVNSFANLRSDIINEFFYREFKAEFVRNKVRNHSHIKIPLGGDVFATVNHLQDKEVQARQACYRDDYSRVNEIPDLLDDEYYNSAYCHILHKGKYMVQEMWIHFPRSPLKNIIIPIDTQKIREVQENIKVKDVEDILRDVDIRRSQF